MVKPVRRDVGDRIEGFKGAPEAEHSLAAANSIWVRRKYQHFDSIRRTGLANSFTYLTGTLPDNVPPTDTCSCGYSLALL